MMLIAALPCIWSLHKYIPPLDEPGKQCQALWYLGHNSTQQAAEKFQHGSRPKHFTLCIKSEKIEWKVIVPVTAAETQNNIFL